MNMSFYSAAVGAIQQQQRMNVQSNNIANVNTHGFRAERASFGALMNRDVIGIVTKINEPKADRKLAELWLRNSGCREIFFVDSVTGEGVEEILAYLNRPQIKKPQK